MVAAWRVRFHFKNRGRGAWSAGVPGCGGVCRVGPVAALGGVLAAVLSCPCVSSAPDRDWNHLLAQARLAEILALLELRLGDDLRARISAEDLLQESLLQAWRDRASFTPRGEHSFQRWLVTLALNRLRDALEHHAAARRTPRAEQAVPSGVEFADSSTPSRAALRGEQAAAIRLALLAVPAEDRDVVRLRLLEERPMADVARELGLSESSARQRYRRGALRYHKELRARLRLSSSA